MHSPTPSYTPPSKTGKLSQAELDDFLLQPWNARLATVTPRNTPYVVPLWYHYEPASQLFYIVGRERAAFIEHIQHNPAVALHIADDIHQQHTRLLVEGIAAIEEGPIAPAASPRLQVMVDDMARRYMGPPGPGYAAKTSDRPRYLIAISPTTMQSWTGGEWAPRYR
jgi:nitroimidazol reductase NimA-like FMN-containing flavoprotein (pyridoxamine 5'-phosphate oxidase superfamily)